MFKNVIQIDVRTLTLVNPGMLIEFICEFIEKELRAHQVYGKLISSSRVG